MPRRCAFGCMPSDVPMHRFPDPVKFPEQCKAWVSLLGGKLETMLDFECHKSKRICDIHFSDSHRNRNKRLSAIAVPMLHLPGQPQTQVTLEQASTSTQHLHPTISQPDNTGQFVSQEQPSTSTQYQQHLTSQSATAGQPQTQVTLEQASTSTQHLHPTISQPDNTGQFVSQEQPSTSTQYQQYLTSQSATAGPSQNITPSNHVTLEHNYSVVSKTRRTAGKEQMGPLLTKVKQLQKDISRLRKKGQSFKARLKNAEDMSSKAHFQHFAKNFNKPTQLFLSMQLQTSKKAKGRRFTTEEKVLSLGCPLSGRNLLLRNLFGITHLAETFLNEHC